jgi:hypothetical protein
MKDFWDKKHRENSLPSLSGHSWPTICRGLYLDPYDVLGKNVLEIGVGLAICSHDLHMEGANLTCCDISEVAMERVKSFASFIFPSALASLPENFFNLAISYCVTQHINDFSLQNQLTYVVKALREDGVFAMQYAFPTYGAVFSEDALSMGAGSVCRPVEKMYDMVKAAHGHIVYHRIFGIYPQYHSGWAIVHVKKGDV